MCFVYFICCSYLITCCIFFFFFSSRRRHTRFKCDWSSDVCSSDLEYSGIAAEHMAVRERAGLFDVSHMGEIEIAGKDALAAVQRISCNDASKLSVGQVQYSGLLTTRGTFVDDLLVYRLAASHFLLVVNASHIADDYAHIVEHIRPAGDAVAVDASPRYALLAVQGPRALEILQPLTGVDLSSIRYYWCAHGEVAGVRAT